MKKLIILLHGVGSSGEGMQGVANYLQQRLTDAVIAVPDGSEKFMAGGSGYQWFSVTGITEESRPLRIVAARAAFDETIRQIIAQHAITPGHDKIIMLGFSQGAIMALDALVSGRHQLTGVVACSGRLSSPEPYQISANAPVLLVHGQMDNVIDWSESASAAAKLQAGGVVVETYYESGTPHTITTSGLSKAAEFIAGL